MAFSDNEKGGGFVSNLAAAALVADHENYPILRPVLVAMRAKYPQYEPSAAVKDEIKRHNFPNEGGPHP